MAKKKKTTDSSKPKESKNKYDEVFKIDMDFDEALKKIVTSKKPKK